jgi:pilus assembly protein CpaE
LRFLKNLYHYVIVDTTPYLTEVILSSIDLADLLVLITTQDIPAIKSSKAFLSLADAIQLKRERIIFIMNRYNRQIAISPEKVGESLKHEISMVIPLDEKIVVPGVNRGIPFMLEAGKTQPVGKGIIGLADLIKERIVNLETPEIAGKR